MSIENQAVEIPMLRIGAELHTEETKEMEMNVTAVDVAAPIIIINEQRDNPLEVEKIRIDTCHFPGSDCFVKKIFPEKKSAKAPFLYCTSSCVSIEIQSVEISMSRIGTELPTTEETKEMKMKEMKINVTAGTVGSKAAPMPALVQEPVAEASNKLSAMGKLITTCSVKKIFPEKKSSNFAFSYCTSSCVSIENQAVEIPMLRIGAELHTEETKEMEMNVTAVDVAAPIIIINEQRDNPLEVEKIKAESANQIAQHKKETAVGVTKYKMAGGALFICLKAFCSPVDVGPKAAPIIIINEQRDNLLEAEKIKAKSVSQIAQLLLLKKMDVQKEEKQKGRHGSQRARKRQ